MALFIPINNKTYNNTNNNNNNNNTNNSGKRISIDDIIEFINNMNKQDEEKDNIINEPEKDISFIIPLEKNMIQPILLVSSNINTILHDYLPNMVHMGVIKNYVFNKDTYNVSLVASILTCIKDDFMLESISSQQSYINILNLNLINMINNKYKELNYKKYGFKQQELIEQIKLFSNTKMILRLYSDYFSINIFLINLNADKIYIPSSYSKHKKSIILWLIGDEFFEPIIYNKDKIYTTCDIITYIIDTNNYTNLFYELDNISDNISDSVVVKNITNKENEVIESSELCDKILNDLSDIEKDNIVRPKKNKNKDNKDKDNKEIKVSDKMKLGELQEIAIKLNISINTEKNGKSKNKTKSELIKEITDIQSKKE
jgi:hypothetical protein